MIFLWLFLQTESKGANELGYPVKIFLDSDPLIFITTILSSRSLEHILYLAIVVIIATAVLGRVFCGWLCPFGSLQQLTGYLWNRKKTVAEKIKNNRYRELQNVKYYILVLFLVMALLPRSAVSVQTGLLDPISLMTRTVNLFLLPAAGMATNISAFAGRYYEEAWFIMIVFVTAVLLNLAVPRFYCRIICPLGALMGIMSRFAIFRVGKNNNACTDCKNCEDHCEGACEPNGVIRTAECVMCLNCRDRCGPDVIDYGTKPSTAGETASPGISRKGFLVSIASGLFAMPGFRLARQFDTNFDHTIIRPPGALDEDEFMKRCIKCGQCIRVCPTNVLQPGGVEGGFENLWTPVLNNRIGSSGCQHNCVACAQVCPTAAIRPITIGEKHGTGRFKEQGFIRIGTAFVDRNRCLPWDMNRPCIVCQENCPVSPKAIYTDEIFSTIRGGEVTVQSMANTTINITGGELLPSGVTSGDYFCLNRQNIRRKISSWTAETVVLSPGGVYSVSRGERIAIQVRLQRPFVDIELCNGCGVCEHECPVSGKRAIRVSGIGDTRSTRRALLLNR